MLSNTEQWTQDDGYFDMYEFFKTIIELFEDEEVGGRSTWSEETLKWWNAWVHHSVLVLFTVSHVPPLPAKYSASLQPKILYQPALEAVKMKPLAVVWWSSGVLRDNVRDPIESD